MAKKEFLIKTRSGNFRACIWFDQSDKAYLVKCVNLPDVVTFGRTLSGAKKMAREAIELYCECAVDENKIIIDDEGRAIGRLPKSHVIQLSR